MPDLQWQALLSIVGFGQIIPVARIHQLAAFSLPEPRSCGLDAEQLRIGLEIPPGPHRLRGIAGSGKTLLLALKAARMHHSHPDWTVAFTFNNKSLYQAIRGHIQRFYHHITGLDPDWSRLRVLHAWGSKQQDGFYRTAAAAAGLQPRSVGWTERLTPEPAQQFALVCQEILDRGPAPEVFDAVLIDEGQDLPPAFYKLAYACLAEPKRLIWAYDEAQSLESFAVPSSEVLFGRTSDGQLKVDLTGVYPGGIHKSRVMRRCYRTPRGILMAGHALGMGLVRRGGPIQGFTTRHQWQDIGYEILEGGFESPGGKVVMTRPHGGSGHPLDSTDDCALLLQGLPDRSTELVWCANEIYRLVGVGVSPDDVLVVLLGEGPGLVSRDVLLRTLSWNLEAKGIAFHRADEKTNAGAFRKRGAVTLSGVRGPPPRVEPFVTHLPYFDVSAAAGKWGNLRASDDVATAWVPATGIGRLDSDMFVVRIQGDSMEPLIPDGCLGVFRRLRSGMTPGQIVLVVRSDEVGDAAVVVKKAVPSLAGYQLESLNPLYEPLPVREADRVIGTYVCSIPGTL